jgi:hypothetical protein
MVLDLRLEIYGLFGMIYHRKPDPSTISAAQPQPQIEPQTRGQAPVPKIKTELPNQE